MDVTRLLTGTFTTPSTSSILHCFAGRRLWSGLVSLQQFLNVQHTEGQGPDTIPVKGIPAQNHQLLGPLLKDMQCATICLRLAALLYFPLLRVSPSAVDINGTAISIRHNNRPLGPALGGPDDIRRGIRRNRPIASVDNNGN